MPILPDEEAGDRNRAEAENKRAVASYFRTMNAKVDHLMEARKHNIQITYPANDRSNHITLLDNQRD